MLCCRDYAEGLVASFANQIKSEYYGGNRSVSIEGIVLEHFITLPQTEINPSTKPSLQHEFFHSFLSYHSKQDYATTTAHINSLIELLKKQKKMSTLSTILENTDVCVEKYRCDT